MGNTEIKPYADLQTLKSIYLSLIYSHLQYCIFLWELAHAITLNPLEKMHKRIIRNMTNSSFFEHITPFFFKLNSLKINDICNLEIAKYMFQINHIITLRDNQTFCLAFHRHKHPTKLSSKGSYFIPRKRTEFGKKSFFFCTSKGVTNCT